jgi:mono/diheme cytochrome c family protein
MNSFKKIGAITFLMLAFVACQDNSKPNYQYMPNMYEAVGYETYQEVDFLPNGSQAMLPPANTINRGWLPYGIENSLEGKELARLNNSPLDSINVVADLDKGKELYGVYCAICHGNKGNGVGWLVEREKILGVPSYADEARNINVGSTYHVIYYGLNSMGSYASQMNTTEMWQVSEYVMTLKKDLTK